MCSYLEVRFKLLIIYKYFSIIARVIFRSRLYSHIVMNQLILMNFKKKESLYTTSWGQSVLVQRKKGLKRLSMRFSLKNKTFMVSAPIRFPVMEIIKFIDSSKTWFTKIINKQLDVVVPKKEIAPGQTIQLLGSPVIIEFIPHFQAKVILNGNVLEVYGIRSKFEQQIMKYLKDLAYERLSEYSNSYAKKLKVTIAKITVKEMSTRFGSCTSLGNLNYCWRIVFSPEPVLAYLCAHEVAHLKEMNHSKAFWTHVENLCPNYAQLRKWLRQHGKELLFVG